MPVMFIGWEGVGLASYLLIGFWYSDDEKASAGKKAFITNRVGDFGFLLGVFTLVSAVRHRRLRRAQAQAAGAVKDTASSVLEIGIFKPATPSAVLTFACLALFVGATGKSRSSRSTSGCPTPWPAPRRSRPSSTPPPW
jgi:NADH-quinone oxidoreductase subunit L